MRNWLFEGITSVLVVVGMMLAFLLLAEFYEDAFTLSGDAGEATAVAFAGPYPQPPTPILPQPNPLQTASPTPTNTPLPSPSPTLSPSPSPSPQPSPTPHLYVVQPGDSFYAIAQRFNITITDLAIANNIRNHSQLYAGTTLTIPPAGVSLPRPDTGYVWPVEYIGLYQGYRYGHTAIDIPAMVGTAVVASADGVVSYSGWHDAGFGYLITIDHADGARTIYAHNSELLVQIGQTVTQGETIALAGSTGYSTHPHVHLGMLVNGRAVNPCEYLPGGC